MKGRRRPRTHPRMLVIGCGWPPETFLSRLFRGLADRGLEIHVAQRRSLQRRSLQRRSLPSSIPFRRLALPTDRLGRPGRWLHGLGLASLAVLRSPGASLEVIRQVPPARLEGPSVLDDLALLRHRFDLLYFPWNAAAVRHLALLDIGIPSLVSCRGTQVLVAPLDPRRRALREGLPRSFERATAVHCVADAVRDRATVLGLDPAKATVIRPGVDPSLFSPAPTEDPEPGAPFRLVQTGSLGWVKGHEYALRAVRQLLDQGRRVELHVLGDGPLAQALRFGIQDMGLEGHVHLHGAVPAEEVAEHLGRAQAFLLPSLSEGISNAALEAMACGLPVIASRCGGMPEAIEHGRDGLLVPLRDPRAMAEAMARLIDEPGLARELAANARRRVEEEFTLERHVDAFFELCSQILGGTLYNPRGTGDHSPVRDSETRP